MHQHNVPSPFHALFNVLNYKKSFIDRFNLAGIVQLLHIFSSLYTINANDNLIKPEFCVFHGGPHCFFLFNSVSSKHCRNLYKYTSRLAALRCCLLKDPHEFS